MNRPAPDEFDRRTWEQLAHDAPARRELLWLLAKLKGDHRQAREVECLDAGLRRRLAPVIARSWHRLHARPRAGVSARELYESVWDERFAHHAARYAGAACRCAGCTAAA